jgi:hypothetical protein
MNSTSWPYRTATEAFQPAVSEPGTLCQDPAAKLPDVRDPTTLNSDPTTSVWVSEVMIEETVGLSVCPESEFPEPGRSWADATPVAALAVSAVATATERVRRRIRPVPREGCWSFFRRWMLISSIMHR